MLAASLVATSHAATRVSVEELQRVVASAQGKSDADVAKQLSDLELTERVSAAGLQKLKASLPGAKAQESLDALADSSQFLRLPASELPNTSAPDVATQRRMLGLVVNYVSKTIHQLPNITAERDTTRFEDRPAQDVQEETGMVSYSYQPLHVVDRFKTPVSYRDGKEELEGASSKHANPSRGLVSWGEFGPILSTVFVDAAKSSLGWGHWETGPGGATEAVFQYAVPKDKSNYQVVFCCTAEGVEAATSARPFQQQVAYHGEIAIDPSNGDILRLVVTAEIEPGNPLTKAASVVEYSSIVIGGQSYVCPLKSISLSQAASIPPSKGSHSMGYALGPQKTFLNRTVFVNYRRFGSESRIVTDADATPNTNPGAESPTGNSRTPPNGPSLSESTLAAQHTHLPAPRRRLRPWCLDFVRRISLELNRIPPSFFFRMHLM
jgi:hypothetical protein